MRVFLQRHANTLVLFSRISFFSLLVIISYIAFLPNYDELPSFTSLSDVFNHFIAFLVLAVFLDFAFSPKYRYLLFILLSYGLFIECVQYFLPNRAFDLVDIIVDLSGVIFYLLIKLGLGKRQ